MLLGVKAVLAESFERIHRSNLVGMGVLPLMFKEGENRQTLGLTGDETFDLLGLEDGLKRPRMDIKIADHQGRREETRNHRPLPHRHGG